MKKIIFQSLFYTTLYSSPLGSQFTARSYMTSSNLDFFFPLWVRARVLHFIRQRSRLKKTLNWLQVQSWSFKTDRQTWNNISELFNTPWNKQRSLWKLHWLSLCVCIATVKRYETDLKCVCRHGQLASFWWMSCVT